MKLAKSQFVSLRHQRSAIPADVGSRTICDFSPKGRFCPSSGNTTSAIEEFDTLIFALYSTNIRQMSARKRFRAALDNELSLHSRDVHVLLSLPFRASVSNGLNSSKNNIGKPKTHCAVLCGGSLAIRPGVLQGSQHFMLSPQHISL
jgi:hypothetical protein